MKSLQSSPEALADMITSGCHDLAVFCDGNPLSGYSSFSPAYLEKVNSILRETSSNNNKVGFILVENLGLASSVFVDFGKEFYVKDGDGEEPKTGIVNGITPDGEVLVHESKRHGLQEGDWVKFNEVQGLNGINDVESGFEIEKVTGAYSFKLKDFADKIKKLLKT